jgi:transcriptional regulator with XRE-family HTH domain
LADVNGIIAANLKRIRETKRLSLDRVADLTGVSKSMLGQIERGESNPTINTIWKIAAGLRVSFTALLDAVQGEAVIVRQAELEPLVADEGRYRVYPVFPYQEGRRFEIYSVELEPGGSYHSESHGERTHEFITVADGVLTVVTGEKQYTVRRGESIAFPADRPHQYQNPGRELTRLSMVIDYSGT